MTPCYLIIGYYNVRAPDVRKIKNHLLDKYNLPLCIVSLESGYGETEIADYIINLDPDSCDFVAQAVKRLESLNLKIIGGFPFWDRAVHEGSKLLSYLGVPCDSPKLALNAASKWAYRNAENEARVIFEEQKVFVPKSYLLLSLEDLLGLLRNSKSGFVLKPTHEAANRGVSFVYSVADAKRAWEEASPWFKDGLLAEEIIPFQSEFSHDGIAHLDWVTRKYSQNGVYPVEIGQEVSASLNTKISERIKKTGRLMNCITGSVLGAFHNEIRLDDTNNIAAAIEPNRRPGGMNIWDLAEKVYRISFYELLIASTLRQKLPDQLPVPRGAAAIRMLPSPYNGKWKVRDDLDLLHTQICSIVKSQIKTPLEFFNFRILKKEGDLITTVAQKNGDFLGQVCAFGSQSQSVERALDIYSDEWRRACENNYSQSYSA